ncbi:hypothetical protein ES695_10645 [Candidatus Atribacteria bacterium 1244-E10-H5-B2]|jgi:hypothetical protein|nr:MAG: hypothetical protein ES695_10645 [Candidatus Atribacteria bacterium 1244-E10-H5-B2]
MGKRKKKREYEGHFAGIDERVMRSEAWKGLKANTKWLYFEFRYRFYGDNPKHIIFTYQEAIKIMSKGAYVKARNKLIERGFIDVIKRGGLEKQPNIYGISDRWKKFETKDFMRVNIKKIFPRIFKKRFKRGHKFLGNQFKKKEHL